MSGYNGRKLNHKLNCSLNKNFVDKRREFYRFRELSNEERNELISLDKRYGEIVCLCKK